MDFKLVSLREPFFHAELQCESERLVVRHFALHLIRAAKNTNSVTLHRKLAAWRTDYLEQLLREQIGLTCIRGPGVRFKRVAAIDWPP